MSRINKIVNNINTDKLAKGLSKFQDPANIIPIACIEGATIVGRSYRGYKRGGKEELGERIFEETACGIIWLVGAKYLNKGINWLGENVFKLKDLDLDIGKDALRDPFENVSKGFRNKTGIFKVASIISSIALSTGLMGIVIPKIRNKMSAKKEAEKQAKSNSQKPAQETENLLLDKQNVSMNDFIQNSKSPNFKGIGGLLTVAHNLENNGIVRLFSSDLGLTTCRAMNARNANERVEFVFRDAASSYGYLGAAPTVIWALNKLTNTKKIHPEALLTLRDSLKGKIGEGIGLETFKKNTFEKTQLPEIFNSIKFEKDVVELESLKGILPDDLFKKAEEMASLQPEKGGKKLLTSLQVKDIFSTSWLSSPDLIRETTQKATYGASSDPRRFVSKKVVDGTRKSLDDFCESFYNWAKKQNIEKITPEHLEAFAKKNVLKATGFTVIGNAVAVFLLAIAIPKIQHLITEYRNKKSENTKNA